MISRNYVFLVQKNDESFCPMPWLEPQFWKIEMKDLLFFFVEALLHYLKLTICPQTMVVERLLSIRERLWLKGTFVSFRERKTKEITEELGAPKKHITLPLKIHETNVFAA